MQMIKKLFFLIALVMSGPSFALFSFDSSESVTPESCDRNVSAEAVSNIKAMLESSCEEFEVVIAEKNERLPLKRIKVAKKEVLTRLKVVEKSPTITLDKKVYPASDVAFYNPRCGYKDKDSGENMTLFPRANALSCRSNLRPLYKNISSDSSEDYFVPYTLINNPHFQKSRTTCISKIDASLKEQVEKYIKSNGGNIVSFKKTNDPFFISNITSDSSTQREEKLINWNNFELEVISNGKKSVLKLQYVLNDNSKISYVTPETDPFGEFYKHSERSGVANIKTGPFTGSWVFTNNSTPIKTTEAGLMNTGTGIVVNKFELSNLSCSEDISFNDDNMSGPEIDNSDRGNSKGSIGTPGVKPKASSGASKQ